MNDLRSSPQVREQEWIDFNTHFVQAKPDLSKLLEMRTLVSLGRGCPDWKGSPGVLWRLLIFYFQVWVPGMVHFVTNMLIGTLKICALFEMQKAMTRSSCLSSLTMYCRDFKTRNQIRVLRSVTGNKWPGYSLPRVHHFCLKTKQIANYLILATNPRHPHATHLRLKTSKAVIFSLLCILLLPSPCN